MRKSRACRAISFIFVCGAVALFYRMLPRSNICLETSTNKSTYKRISDVSVDLGSNESLYQNKVDKIERIVLSLVACDQRLNESLNSIKSVLIFTQTPVHFVIFADTKLTPKFEKQLGQWRDLRNGTFSFELQPINFPEKNREQWMNLFLKCASQRLFIPSLLTHIDSIIYVDTDTLFLGPADHLWSLFSKFNATQISALALEDENPNVSWYPRFAKHPFYGKVGVNSGVMLMNLTRMREFEWANYLSPIMLKYKLYLPWGDQDIINVIFHYHPEALYVMSCRCNYRTDQCMYGDACAPASRDGALVLHASRKAFHTDKQPAFKAIYQAVDEHDLGTDLRYTLLPYMKAYFDGAQTSYCGSLKDAFLKVPQHSIDNMYEKPER